MRTLNFNKVYEKILAEESSKIIKLQRRKQLLQSLAIILIIICVFIAIVSVRKNIILSIFLMDLILVFAFIFRILIVSRYNTLCKETIINALLRNYSEDLNFYANLGISQFEYDNADFSTTYNKFRSKGLIEGNVDDEYDIKITRISLYNDSGDYRTTTFLGFFGIVNTSDVTFPDFYVSVNKNKNRYNNSRMELEFTEFEKYFDLYADDKINVMRIFTPDLIEEFNRAKQELRLPIEVKASNGELFFRIKTENDFAAPNFKDALDYEILYNNFKLIDTMIRLISKIVENGRMIQD